MLFIALLMSVIADAFQAFIFSGFVAPVVALACSLGVVRLVRFLFAFSGGDTQ